MTGRLVTIDASDLHPGRVDRTRMGRRNPAGAAPRPPKVDLTKELIASMEETVRIIAGEQPPSQVHKAAEIAARGAARAAKQG